jgi:hypothetical protein
LTEVDTTERVLVASGSDSNNTSLHDTGSDNTSSDVSHVKGNEGTSTSQDTSTGGSGAYTEPSDDDAEAGGSEE